jgi:hypothetical protein
VNGTLDVLDPQQSYAILADVAQSDSDLRSLEAGVRFTYSDDKGAVRAFDADWDDFCQRRPNLADLDNLWAAPFLYF